MSEHIVTGTTEEEREKEIYDYAIKCGWSEDRAQSYAIFLGHYWLPELEQNYVEFFHHLPLSDIKVGEFTLNSLFDDWGRWDLRTAVWVLWIYKEGNYKDSSLVHLHLYGGGLKDRYRVSHRKE